MRTLDEIDRAIILAVQDGLPLAPDPYGVVAEALGLAADEVIERLAAMQADGVVRRIGVVPNHYALGYRFNGMTVWDVADDDVEEAARLLCAPGFVSHCYQRPRKLPHWPYNLFAMVHARAAEQADALVAELASGLHDLSRGHRVLFSTRILKKTGLRLIPPNASAVSSRHCGGGQARGGARPARGEDTRG